jgi:hypothetical protein
MDRINVRLEILFLLIGCMMHCAELSHNIQLAEIVD